MKSIIFIISILFCISTYAENTVRNFDLAPGTCMYIKGSKVCALNPVHQVITYEGIAIPVGSYNNQAQNTVIIPGGTDTKYMTVITQPKSGDPKTCKCPIEDFENGGYTIEKEENGKKTFIRVRPTTYGCNCQ